MSDRDFRSFKNGDKPGFDPRIIPGGVPIIGGGPAAQLRDKYNRVLEVGDFVDLQTGAREPYRVTKIEPASHDPRVMVITLASTLQFLAAKDSADPAFIRVMSAVEVEAWRGARQTMPIDPPAIQPAGDLAAPGDAPVAAPPTSSPQGDGAGE